MQKAVNMAKYKTVSRKTLSNTGVSRSSNEFHPEPALELVLACSEMLHKLTVPQWEAVRTLRDDYEVMGWGPISFHHKKNENDEKEEEQDEDDEDDADMVAAKFNTMLYLLRSVLNDICRKMSLKNPDDASCMEWQRFLKTRFFDTFEEYVLAFEMLERTLSNIA